MTACSGVAVLMELAHDLPKLKTRFGVDIVMLDAEEFVFRRDGGALFPRARSILPGSTRRAGLVTATAGACSWTWWVPATCTLYEEANSLWWRDTRPLVDSLWGTAQRLGVREFIRQKKYEMIDDHLALHNTGHIPTCDVIDFDYPPWHTRGDTPDKCSALSLAKVGWVLREWLVTDRQSVNAVESRKARHGRPQGRGQRAGMELWFTIAVGLVLSATAAGLMVSHVRTWRRFEESGDAADPRERGYRRRQFRRRVQTSALLGLLAVALVAGHWVTSPPWRPWAFAVYWGMVLTVVAWVALLALADLVSTRLYFGRVRDRYRLEEMRLKAELERLRRTGTMGRIRIANA